MAIKRFSDMKKDADPKQRKASLVKKIATSAKKIDQSIASTEVTINKAHAAFEDAKRVFTPVQVQKAIKAFQRMGKTIAIQIKTTSDALRTAVRADIPNDKLIAQLEDLHALKGKLSALYAQASASLDVGLEEEDLDEEFVELDESGFIVDSEDPVEEIVEEEPMVDEEATEAAEILPEATVETTAEESDLEKDNDSGFDMTTDKEQSGETHNDNPVDRAENAAPGESEEADPPARSLEGAEETADRRRSNRGSN